MRHVLEYYECFLDQFEELHIDYAERRREHTVETDRHAALSRISALAARLENCPELLHDYTIWVRMEHQCVPTDDPYLCSSTGRELQSLASHTVHHFALIRLALQAFGVAIPEDFGVAPSTQSFLRKRAA